MKALIVAIVLFLSTAAFSQTNPLIVQGTAPDLYINHTVAPKESYYSLARLYNIAPGTLAGFNKSNLQTGLRIGQGLKVPLTVQNFEQNGRKDAAETLVPLYHIVAKNETLFRIGANHNKVALSSIKEWNNMATESISAGTPLIVGYLKVKTEQAALLPTDVSTTAAPVAVNATPAKEDAAPKPTFSPDPLSEPVTQPTAVVKQTPAEAEAAKNAPARTSQPVVAATENKPAPAKEEVPLSRVEKPSSPKTDLLAPAPAGAPDEGFFVTDFAIEANEKQLTENTGEAGTFKSVSGWQNKKYYVLINNVEPGTIVKITAADKAVYAKVLGGLPEVKDDKNLLLRLSNAAASYLGKVDPKFPVQVQYYK